MIVEQALARLLHQLRPAAADPRRAACRPAGRRCQIFIIGIRISWLIVARNMLLARVAARASSRAWRSASAWAAARRLRRDLLVRRPQAHALAEARLEQERRHHQQQRHRDAGGEHPERQQRALVVEERLARQHAQMPSGCRRRWELHRSRTSATRDAAPSSMRTPTTASSEISAPTSVFAEQDALEETGRSSARGSCTANGPRWPMGTNTTKPRPPAWSDGRCNHRLAAVARPVERGTTLGCGAGAGAGEALVNAIGSTHRMMPSASTQTSAR